MDNKFSFKWVALLASAAGTPWMVHQSTQGRSGEAEVTANTTENAQALWDSAKGSLASVESYFKNNNSQTGNQTAAGWSMPSDPKSLYGNNGAPATPQGQISQVGWGGSGQTVGPNAGYQPLPAAGAPVGQASSGVTVIPGAPTPALQPDPVDFREFFRFDATPDWVVQKYPRVSTVSSERELDGYRAPMVTGTGLKDLSGTITYYFDRFQKVQRIQFQGLTGDPQPLIFLMTKYYYFSPQPILGGQLFVVAWNAKPTGVMEITRANVVFAQNQANSFRVFLEINQPNVPNGVSIDGQQILRRHLGGPTER